MEAVPHRSEIKGWATSARTNCGGLDPSSVLVLVTAWRLSQASPCSDRTCLPVGLRQHFRRQ